jgi:hypothetical protein
MPSRDKEPESFLNRIARFFRGDQPDYGAIRLKQQAREQKVQSLLASIAESRLISEDIKPISELRLGKVHIHGMFKQVTNSYTRNRLRVTKALLYDETGNVVTVWFNANVGLLIKPLTVYEVTGTFKLNLCQMVVALSKL